MKLIPRRAKSELSTPSCRFEDNLFESNFLQSENNCLELQGFHKTDNVRTGHLWFGQKIISLHLLKICCNCDYYSCKQSIYNKV